MEPKEIAIAKIRSLFKESSSLINERLSRFSSQMVSSGAEMNSQFVTGQVKIIFETPEKLLTDMVRTYVNTIGPQIDKAEAVDTLKDLIRDFFLKKVATVSSTGPFSGLGQMLANSYLEDYFNRLPDEIEIAIYDLMKESPDSKKETALILFLAANPEDQSRLRLEEECRAIQKKLRSSKYRDRIDLRSEWAIRPDDLLQALNEYAPQIVHFSGHGGPDAIALQDDKGNTYTIKSKALTRLFEATTDKTRIVVLNSCYSQFQAEAIATVIPCVVGIEGRIDDQAAKEFAASFYQALAFGASVDNAVRQGRAAIALKDLGGEDLIKLTTMEGVDPKKLCLF